MGVCVCMYVCPTMLYNFASRYGNETWHEGRGKLSEV